MLTLSPSKIALFIHGVAVVLLVWILFDSNLLDRVLRGSLIGSVIVAAAVTILIIFVAKSLRFLATSPDGQLHFCTSADNASNFVWQPKNLPSRAIKLLSVHGRSDWLLRLRYQEIASGKNAELVIFPDSGSTSERRALRKFLLAEGL